MTRLPELTGHQIIAQLTLASFPEGPLADSFPAGSWLRHVRWDINDWRASAHPGAGEVS